MDMENKTVEELKKLKEAGLKLIYVGIETGDNELLTKINKGEDSESISRNLLKAKEAGIKIISNDINRAWWAKSIQNNMLNNRET